MITRHLMGRYDQFEQAACGAATPRDRTGVLLVPVAVTATEATCPDCLRAEADRLEGESFALRQRAANIEAARAGEAA